MQKRISLLSLALMLSACGGGGSDSGSSGGSGGSGGGGSTVTTYTVTATAGVNGSISPTSRVVNSGQVTTFTVTPAAGYSIASVTGCSGTLSETTYTTGPVTANCAVSASFQANTYSVTTKITEGGTISPQSVTVTYNETAEFTLTADIGYQLLSATGCNGTLTGNLYKTGPITAACEITASFAEQYFTVSTESSAGGSLAPASLKVAAGGRAEFDIVAEQGYRFTELTGCQGFFAGNKFVIPAVTESCQLKAAFNDASYVEFPDPALAAAVREALKLAADEPIPAALLSESLTFLDAYSRGITRLDGLQYATGLSYLYLGGNNLADVSILTQLALNQTAGSKQLRSLYLSNSNISTLPDLRGFSMLNHLGLTGNKLKDISNLAGFTSLTQLELNYNPLTDISVVAGLKLESLGLMGLPVTDADIRSIDGAVLENLRVDSSNVASADAFSHLTALTSLSAGRTFITDVTPFALLPKLKNLTLYLTPVIDIAPLLDFQVLDGLMVQVGGCLKLDGFSRAKLVAEAINERGGYVYLDSSSVFHTRCAVENLIQNFTGSGELTEAGLALNWQLQSDDTGPWQCELHFDLDRQLPRVPVKTLENCHQVRNWQVTDVKRSELMAHLVIDTGLTKIKNRFDLGTITANAGKPDPYVAGYDWLQAVVKANPLLVPWRESRLRLHILSTTGAKPPQVLVNAVKDGVVTPLEVKAPVSLLAVKHPQTLTSGYFVTVPAAQMAPGTEYVVKVADQPEFVISPQFATVNSIDLKVVPFKLGDLVVTLPDNSLIERSLLTVWPLASINITTRAPYELTTQPALNTNSTMLRELYDLSVAEGGAEYYYGYFTAEMKKDMWGGMAYRPGKTAVGQVPYNNELDMTLSHELGHNFGLAHAPCNDPSDPDQSFPYAGAKIGSYGVNLSLNQILQPDSYTDLMGYCHNKHVSDYNYEIAQDLISRDKTNEAIHLRQSAATRLVTADAAQVLSTPNPALFYRVTLEQGTSVRVEQVMQLDHVPLLQAAAGFSLLAEYVNGAPDALPVQLLVVGHGDDAPQLSFAVPLVRTNDKLIGWTLYQGNKALLAHQHSAQPELSAQADAVNSTGIFRESGNQICIDLSGKGFDAANLFLTHGTARSAVAINVQASQFCRDTTGYQPNGSWQLQLRRGTEVSIYQTTR